MKKFLILLLLSSITFSVQAFENFFYVLRNDSPDSNSPTGQALRQHWQKISGIISQAYQIEPDGVVIGGINPDLVSFAHQHHIKIYAMVTNLNFDQAKVHAFLNSSDAQYRAISTLISHCQEAGLTGLQIDFEHMPVEDKYVLNHFADRLAEAMHKARFQLSFALFPRTRDEADPKNAFWSSKYATWAGVYDYRALAEDSNFVSIMTYDQHTASTPPGPVAGIPWDEAVIRYALHYIPKNKISLGIPTYSDHWFSGSLHGKPHYKMENMGYADVAKLIKELNTSTTWDSTQAVPFTFFIHDDLNEFIFGEDVRSFKAKYALAHQYHLNGVSVWRIGLEDPRIWQVTLKSSH